MQIGEAAKASGCPIETIRYYERVGLLPRAGRTESGYRSYSSAEVDRMRFITRGRELGFSLDEIRSLLSLSQDASLSCEDVDRLARAHLAEIRQRVRALNRLAKELAQTIHGCRGGQRAQCSILSALQRPTKSSKIEGRAGTSHAESVHRRGNGAI